MNKNVLLVFIVILTPIVILGALAMAGAENFEKQKEAAQHEEGNQTEAATILVPLKDVEQVSSPLFVSSHSSLCLTA